MKSDREFEQDLRRAMRPQAPPRDLAGPVLARLRSRPEAGRQRTPRYFAWLAIAACLLLLAGALIQVTRQQARRREAQASAARILAALNLASNDLSRIQQRIRTTPVPRISQ